MTMAGTVYSSLISPRSHHNMVVVTSMVSNLENNVTIIENIGNTQTKGMKNKKAIYMERGRNKSTSKPEQLMIRAMENTATSPTTYQPCRPFGNNPGF